MPCKELYKDRIDAATKLLDVLPTEQMKSEDWSLIAVSSGGLEIAKHIGNKLKLKTDFLFSEAITAPNNPECEIARVSETEEIVMDETLINSFEIQVDYIYGEANRKHEEKILSKMFQYRHGKHFEVCINKTIMLIDEGSENGFKFLVAIKSILAMQPKAIYIAVPVVPVEVVDALEPLADEIFSVHELRDYIKTSCYYSTLEKLTDDEIEKILGV